LSVAIAITGRLYEISCGAENFRKLQYIRNYVNAIDIKFLVTNRPVQRGWSAIAKFRVVR